MNRPVNKLIKTNVFLAILSVLSVILVASGVSYALFKVENKNTENQVIAIGNLSINMTDNNAIEVLNLYPQTESSLTSEINKIYTFTPSNNGDYTVRYEIYLTDTTSNVASNYSEYTTLNTLGTNYYQYINFKLDGGEVQNLGSVYNSSTGRMVIMTGELISGQSAGEHTLQFWLSSTAPNDMIGTVLSLDITMEGTAIVTESEKTLASLNITPNTTATPDFTNTSPSDVQGVFAMEDDYGTSYYYRGNITNNYVKFGAYSDSYKRFYNSSPDTYSYPSQALCEANNGVGNCSIDTSLAGKDIYWRIIRINGDGSLRIQYDGTIAHTNYESSNDRIALNGVKWHSNINDAKYAGYMFGGTNGSASTSKEQAQTNETNSDMKNILETWYENVFANTTYEQYISDEIFCNDRSTAEVANTWVSNDTALGYSNYITYYGSQKRISDVKNPSLKCPQKNDAFTKNDNTHGNGDLTFPIGLITGDESSITGGRLNSTNSKYYIRKGSKHWTFTPYRSWGNVVYIYQIYYDGQIFSDRINTTAAVAPVINLSAEAARQLIGDGTAENPYRFE